MDAKKRVVRRRRRRRLIVPKALSASMKKENPTRARHSHSRHSPAENGPQFNATPSNPNARVISRPIPTSRRRPLLDSAIWKDLFTRSRAGRETSKSRTLIHARRRKVSDARHARRAQYENANAKKRSRAKETTTFFSRTVSEHLSGRHLCCLCACVMKKHTLGVKTKERGLLLSRNRNFKKLLKP